MVDESCITVVMSAAARDANANLNRQKDEEELKNKTFSSKD
jgi:hypothetical protein